MIRFWSKPLAAMLAASASISALVCGVLRTFLGDFLRRLRGTNKMSPLFGFSFLAMVFSFGQGSARNSAHEPLPSGETGGSKGMGGGRVGNHPPRRGRERKR